METSVLTIISMAVLCKIPEKRRLEGVLDNIPQKRYIINISARRPPLEEAATD
jgi:hypothetical protein